MPFDTNLSITPSSADFDHSALTNLEFVYEYSTATLNVGNMPARGMAAVLDWGAADPVTLASSVASSGDEDLVTATFIVQHANNDASGSLSASTWEDLVSFSPRYAGDGKAEIATRRIQTPRPHLRTAVRWNNANVAAGKDLAGNCDVGEPVLYIGDWDYDHTDGGNIT